MNRGPSAISGVSRWEQYEGMSVSGSLVVTHTPASPKSFNHQQKTKYDDFGFKNNQLSRHDSEKQLNKI